MIGWGVGKVCRSMWPKKKSTPAIESLSRETRHLARDTLDQTKGKESALLFPSYSRGCFQRCNWREGRGRLERRLMASAESRSIYI